MSRIMNKETITIFLDDRQIFIKTLEEFDYKEKLREANIEFKYTDQFSEDIIRNFEIVFIFLDTCWNNKNEDVALLEQINLIKNVAIAYPKKRFLVFPYSTTFRDTNEFTRLYKQFAHKPTNIILDKEPFLIRRNSSYQMNGIIAMIKSKKSEMENA